MKTAVSCLISNPSPDDPRIRRMREKLDAFYADTTAYTAFNSPPDNSEYYRAMEPYLREVMGENRRVKVLELGTGRPTFPIHFKELRDRIEYHVQDVTPKNEPSLRELADRVFIGDVSSVGHDGNAGGYDLVFSTFVFEHVSAPQAFLEDVRRLLRPGGIHLIFCPRYDAPGYLCPSLRHVGRMRRVAMMTFLAGSRIRARIDRRARFWVNCDPAVFHTNWYRDADAVHVVSRWDVERWHRANGFEVERLWLGYKGWRQYILRRHLTLALAVRKLRD